MSRKQNGTNANPADYSHPRLPNGFGTIRYLGPGRRRPYAVHPHREADVKAGAALCYVSDWFIGLAILAAWNAGIYEKGMENRLDGQLSGMMNQNHARKKTIQEIYDLYIEWKFGENAPRKLSDATRENTETCFQKLKPIQDRFIDEVSIEELQKTVNAAGKGNVLLSKTILLLRQLYRFSIPRGYATRNTADYVLMPDSIPSKHHEDFNDEELSILWDHQDDPVIRTMLIMCYSGFRIGAYQEMKINLEGRYFQGGIKTAAGKDRIVPIHSLIQPLVEEMAGENRGFFQGCSISWFRKLMKRKLVELGIDQEGRRHSPHSCRHTFSRLCESYGVREADRKRMMGHSFHNDITNGTYGHRTVEELRTEIEKIRKPIRT